MPTPDQLEKDLGQTRQSLSKDVNRLNDRVSPGRFVGTRSERIKNSASSIKDKLMGSAGSAANAAGDKLGSAVGSVREQTDSAGGSLSGADAAQALREKTQGSPMGAGVVAFGVGWLLSALIPVSDAEQHAAKKIEDNASAVVDPLTQSAKQVAGNLQQPLQDSAAALKDTATDAANTTAEHARSATDDVKSHAQHTAGDIKDQAQDTAGNVADKAQNAAEQQNRSR